MDAYTAERATSIITTGSMIISFLVKLWLYIFMGREFMLNIKISLSFRISQLMLGFWRITGNGMGRSASSLPAVSLQVLAR